MTLPEKNMTSDLHCSSHVLSSILQISSLLFYLAEHAGECPKQGLDGLFGVCLFDPNVNCLQDTECKL